MTRCESPIHQVRRACRRATQLFGKASLMVVVVEGRKLKRFDSYPKGAARRSKLYPHIPQPASHARIQNIRVDRRNVGRFPMREDATFDSPIDEQDARIARM